LQDAQGHENYLYNDYPDAKRAHSHKIASLKFLKQAILQRTQHNKTEAC
jgi:hypothetical protein